MTCKNFLPANCLWQIVIRQKNIVLRFQPTGLPSIAEDIQAIRKLLFSCSQPSLLPHTLVGFLALHMNVPQYHLSLKCHLNLFFYPSLINSLYHPRCLHSQQISSHLLQGTETIKERTPQLPALPIWQHNLHLHATYFSLHHLAKDTYSFLSKFHFAAFVLDHASSHLLWDRILLISFSSTFPSLMTPSFHFKSLPTKDKNLLWTPSLLSPPCILHFLHWQAYQKDISTSLTPTVLSVTTRLQLIFLRWLYTEL